MKAQRFFVCLVSIVLSFPFAAGVARPDNSPVIGMPTYVSPVPGDKSITVTVEISDQVVGGHGILGATLYYGYTAPYNQSTVSGTGPGGNGDGTWTFLIPAQGSAHNGQTLYFSIEACDNADTPACPVNDNSGNYFAVDITCVGCHMHLPLVFRNWEYLPQPITPNDTHYTTYQWNLPQVRASYAWAVSTGSSDVVVAVLDTGADLTHPDLQGKFVAGYDFIHNGADPSDDEGHGTHVAGIVAALTDNSQGVAGVSWGGKIMPVKVLDWQGLGVSSQIAQGIIWATDHGARIINMSLGGENGSATLQNAVNYAYSRGALVVAAAGNEYQAGNPVIYPAAYPHVLAVAATGNEDEHARYSETGYYVDVAAPGGNPTSSWDSNPNHWIMSTCWRGASYGEYAQIAGTSQAAPHVAGLAALVWSVNPTLSNDQVEQIIEETAVDVGTPGRDDVFGYGRIDAYRALARASRGALAAEPVQGQPALPSAHVSLSSISRVPIRGTEPTRAEFAAGVVLVKFRSGVRQETISSVLGRYSVQVTGRIPALGVLRLSVPVGAEIDVSERLSQDPAVEYAEPDYLVQAFRVQ